MTDQKVNLNSDVYACRECEWVGMEENADPDSHNWIACPDCGANLERLFRASEFKQCNICGGTVNLTNAAKPSVSFGKTKK